MTTPTFSPPINPAPPHGSSFADMTDVKESERGYPILLNRHEHAPRRLVLRWPVLTTLEMEEIVSFFTQELGDSDRSFLWTPINAIISPSGNTPRLEAVTGTQGPATYYVKFTWYDVTYGETLPSKQGSITIAASQFMKLTVPPIPNPMDGFRVYASETSGSEVLQATVTTGVRTWTQAGALGAGASPPTSNTAKKPTKFALVGPVNPILDPRIDRYRLEITAQELFF